MGEGMARVTGFSSFLIATAMALSFLSAAQPPSSAMSTLSPEGLPDMPLSPPPDESILYSGTGLPSLDPDDAKFFGVAGEGLSTLAGVKIVLYVGLPVGTSTFTVGLFDGDVGGTWDGGTTPFSYRLYKDPLKNGTTAMLVDTISSSSALNDAWYDKSYSTDSQAKAPSGNYFYRLESTWTGGTPSGDFNNFKVRTSGQISVRAGQDFGFAAGPQNIGSDPPVGSGDPNPGDTNDPNANSYDGRFTYYFYVPVSLTSITFWDGDADRAGDTDDPNTPNTDPDGGGPAGPEGENEGAPSDGPSPYEGANVDPSIYYDVLDPDDHLFTNNNPSGNTEWERFIIGNSASSPDITVTYSLSAGLWRFRVQGMDAHNLNVLRSVYEIYSTQDVPLTVNPPPSVTPDNEKRSPDNTVVYYAHTVKNNGALMDFDLTADSDHGWDSTIYADTDGDGEYDAGEPEITQTGPMAPNQALKIVVAVTVPDLGSGATDVTTVTASSRTEWALQGSATDTTIINSPPNAVLSAPSSVPEGTEVTLDATGSSDPDGDTLEYRWDFEGDGVWDIDWGTLSVVKHTWGDDIEVVPTVEVRDSEFRSAASTQITVLNVAPSAEVTVDLTGLESTVLAPDEEVRVSVHVTDPGSDEINWLVEFELLHFSSGQDCNPTCPDPDPSADVNPADFVIGGGFVYGDNGVYRIAVVVEDDDGGIWQAVFDARVDNVIPSISLVEPPSYTIDEAVGITLEASITDPGSDDLTVAWDFGDGATESRTYFNDGVGPDGPRSPLGNAPFSVTDTASHVYGDDGTFTVTLVVTDDDGGTVTVQRTVEVLNVAPTITTADVFAEASFRLRVAGEKWHDVRLAILENDVEAMGTGVTRYPGSPDEQSATIGMSRLGLSAAWRILLYYTPDDDPVNGQPNGATPVWVIVTLPDGRELRLHHTFNVRHSATWEWEPGEIRAFLLSGAVVEVTATDPGSDDLTIEIDFGDGSSYAQTFYNNGVSPDPDPSTEVNPITATVLVAHAWSPGTYVITFVVHDDDGGAATLTIVLSG